VAEGWLMTIGLAALACAVGVVIVALRAREGSPKAADGLLALGPTLVALGILFGDEPLVGYGLIGSGVIVAIVAAVRGRSRPRG